MSIGGMPLIRRRAATLSQRSIWGTLNPIRYRKASPKGCQRRLLGLLRFLLVAIVPKPVARSLKVSVRHRKGFDSCVSSSARFHRRRRLCPAAADCHGPRACATKNLESYRNCRQIPCAKDFKRRATSSRHRVQPAHAGQSPSRARLRPRRRPRRKSRGPAHVAACGWDGFLKDNRVCGTTSCPSVCAPLWVFAIVISSPALEPSHSINPRQEKRCADEQVISR